MQAVMKKLGHIKSEEEAKEMIAAYDKDKGGTIDFHEYLLLVAEATEDKELCAPHPHLPPCGLLRAERAGCLTTSHWRTWVLRPERRGLQTSARNMVERRRDGSRCGRRSGRKRRGTDKQQASASACRPSP